LNTLSFIEIICFYFSELELTNGTEMLVGDPARASSMRVILSLTSSMETSTTK